MVRKALGAAALVLSLAAIAAVGASSRSRAVAEELPVTFFTSPARGQITQATDTSGAYPAPPPDRPELRPMPMAE
jgi:hypothetical protein